MILYKLAHVVEEVSVKAGWGDFDLQPEDWICDTCLSTATALSSPSCTKCQKQWIHKLGMVEYSDAFERRLNIIVGIACLVLGASVWGLNVVCAWWEWGGGLAVINELLKSYTPKFIRTLLSTPLAASLLILTLVTSTLALLASLSIITFLMLSNPTSTRHWRHMSPAMYGVIFVQFVVEMVFVSWGVKVRELAFVVGPVLLGGSALVGVVLMRGKQGADQEVRDLESGEGNRKVRKVEREM